MPEWLICIKIFSINMISISGAQIVQGSKAVQPDKQWNVPCNQDQLGEGRLLACQHRACNGGLIKMVNV